jgi:hypothetical protein
MQFQHTTPMPSGISFSLQEITSASLSLGSVTPAAANMAINVPQTATVVEDSGTTSTIIPGNGSDTLSISLHQLFITWGEVMQEGKFEVRSLDETPLTIYQDGPAGNLILPCWDELKLLGRHGLQVVNSATGGEYSISAYYSVKEF